MAYVIGDYTISRDGTLTGPDNCELIAALGQQGFEPTAEDYDSNDTQPEQQDKLIIEVPIGENWLPAKMDNLERLIASRETLLKKVLGGGSLETCHSNMIRRRAQGGRFASPPTLQPQTRWDYVDPDCCWFALSVQRAARLF